MQEVKKIGFLSGNTYFMTERDYAEAFKSEFDMEIHSEVFGFNCNISI